MIPLILCLATVLGADESISKVNELGPVRVTTSLTPREPTIGDEITLEIRVESDPGVDLLMPEFGEALSRYTILDFIPKQQIADDGRSIATQRYTLQPYLSGDQSIPPILIEFVDNRPGQKRAPDDCDAYEILTDRIDFQVKSVLPDSAAGQLNPPLGALELIQARSPSITTWLVTGSLAALVAVVATVVFWRSRRRRVQRRNAYELARAKLDRLLSRKMPENEVQVAGFFVDISAIIRRYLEDRFDVRAPELTTEEFLAVAGTSGVLSHEHQGLLRDFLRQADLVKFAGVQATANEIRLSSDLAIRFLEETRENAPLVEVTGAEADADNAAAASRDTAFHSFVREDTNV